MTADLVERTRVDRIHTQNRARSSPSYVALGYVEYANGARGQQEGKALAVRVVQAMERLCWSSPSLTGRRDRRWSLTSHSSR